MSSEPPRGRLASLFIAASCVAGPALLQGQTVTCSGGETRLAELSVTVDGVEQVAFDAENRDYDAWLADAPADVLVLALPQDPEALVYINVGNDAGHQTLMDGVAGGGEALVPLILGRNLISVYVKAPEGASGVYEIVTRVCEGDCPAARQWGQAQLLEDYDVDSAYEPRVVWTPTGEALAIWIQASADGDEVWSRRYARAAGWLAPERIESTYARSKTWPQLVIDGDGNAMAVWSQGQIREWELWANRYTPDGGWGAEERIDTTQSLNFETPSVAGDADGNVIVVWSDQDEATLRYDMWSNRYSPDTGWGAPELIETRDDSSASWEAVEMDANGNAIAVWEQIFGARHDIWAARYTPTGGWGAAEPIENEQVSSDFRAELAFDHEGNAVVVWYRFNRYSPDKERDIWSNRYTVGQGWGTAERIDANDERRYSSQARVSVDPDGRALACWQQLNDSEFSIWCNWGTRDGWGAPELIEQDTLGNGFFPQPAFDRDGSALVVWERYDEIIFGVWANRYTRAGGWETAERIDSDDRGDARRPHLALHPTGHAIVAWQQSDGEKHDVWWNRFE